MESCPKCKSNMIIDIVYGFPTKKMLEDASKNKINLGGHEISENNLEKKCKSCGHEFRQLEKFFREWYIKLYERKNFVWKNNR